MSVLAIKSEQKCKLCVSPHRSEMDALLEKRSRKQKDDDGNVVNLEYVQARYAELHTGAALTKENVTGHWKNHCQLVTEEEAAQASAEAVAQVAEILNLDPSQIDVETYLLRIIQLDAYETEQRILEGKPSGITKDHALKAAAELARRGVDKAKADLLGAVTSGIAAAQAKKMLEGVARPALPAPVDVEAEEVFAEQEAEDARADMKAAV